MFRTADGAGVNKIYLTGYTACPPHPQLDKVSLGAEKWVAWEHKTNTVPLIKKLKHLGYTVVALEKTKKSVNIYTWQPASPVVLVVGNEVDGVSPAILKLCDRVVHLPMHGQKNSLNVSVAAGAAMYYISSKILPIV